MYVCTLKALYMWCLCTNLRVKHYSTQRLLQVQHCAVSQHITTLRLPTVAVLAVYSVLSNGCSLGTQWELHLVRGMAIGRDAVIDRDRVEAGIVSNAGSKKRKYQQ
jgi:hypothetical protein